ncbi:D-alanyl-D-alanine carboxypeptidase family protein [Roseinatronobacter bogoriensis]|uniref:serine-type D-Ala-D-Ala carboxypeptidase n=1 Tax=Roseinatronobacter bogoriensis subsp. barguzinensis TaxID=441209 RepID=A0A2K8KJW5_9RHOB|nr:MULTISPECIES: D-alanyl-D-alanine carboxypeptidase family protein [Rhodobaca]ATX66600.1 D-alanyl-D-alanine carboxypeptidase [Rhodobaca barguzinensis]MBB4207775.1 D-alanyl-D-alanine carboxypeptidase (penicillin-binding protein 5/6) [Rhodobaca bogoriensis DSM 18756]TDW39918.1 D-alanyl-D-alanine carboxypeptidase (penicillin-binding protein 5/6) [Rhodobaca barguzinensis]TDY70929.1 D-alanyl-D-alanine carboxypeptidase (penicillin-binding protein 5/6) [Rhodobaca bogoriensis DSM 18756]
MNRTLRQAVAISCGALVAAISLPDQISAQAVGGFETNASSAYVRDLTTGTVLLDKAADVPLPPASMSKLMTLLMLFEAIEEGRTTLDTTFTVSERAYQMGGSRMFLEPTDRPTAEDLIRGIAVLSGNDATVVVAEGLAGTEEAFAQLATRRARELGMRNTTLANSSGWPHPDHLMSKRDLGILAEYIITNFPQYYPYLAEREFTWNGITQPNRVPLLGAGVGLDGLKTGFTSAAGYSLTGSVRQGDRRIVFAFGGLDSERARVQEAEAIINWAFRQFAKVSVGEVGAVMAEAPVWLGESDSVPLVLAESAEILVPAIGTRALEARVVYDSPLPAPIVAGETLGTLIVDIPEMGEARLPLVAGADVAEGGFGVRATASAQRLFNMVLGSAREAMNQE